MATGLKGWEVTTAAQAHHSSETCMLACGMSQAHLYPTWYNSVGEQTGKKRVAPLDCQQRSQTRHGPS